MSDFDDCLDGSEIGISEGGKLFGHFVKLDPVSDPKGGVDFSIRDELDDFGEIGRVGIAGGQQGEFAAMKNRRVRKAKLLSRDAYVNHTSGVGGELKASGHGMYTAGGIDDDIGEM